MRPGRANQNMRLMLKIRRTMIATLSKTMMRRAKIQRITIVPI